MKVAIYESNLMWSERLRRGAITLGHEATVYTKSDLASAGTHVAILNLGESQFADAEWIAKLHEAGVVTIGHAGHKETPLWDAGRVHGVQHIVSNGTIANKLAEVLALAHPTA